jgi:hypothetical protein
MIEEEGEGPVTEEDAKAAIAELPEGTPTDTADDQNITEGEPS